MSFQTGLSGLNAASANLEVIGNNVANSSTVGFKTSQAQFADVFAASLSGGGGNQIGIGTRLATVAQQFTQGNISTSNNPLDVAINGQGFFVLSDNGASTYSRNGQFQLNKDGFIVNNTGLKLQGYQVDSAGGVTGAQGDIYLDSADIPPKVSNIVAPLVNLDSRSTVPTGAAIPAMLVAVVPATVPPTYIQPTTDMYNSSTSTTIYDSLGNPHVAAMFFGKTAAATVTSTAAALPGATAASVATAAATAAALPGATASAATVSAAAAAAAALPGATASSVAAAAALAVAGTWDVHGIVDGGSYNAGAVLNFGSLVFNTSGQLTSPVGPPVGLTATAAIGWTDPSVAAQTLGLNLNGSTQFGSPFGVNALTQDGYAAGRLAGFAIGDDGIVQGRYTNGQTNTLGQVILANFANPRGLHSLGDNQWSETSASGQALIGGPGTSSLGVLQSSATEDSNVDLTAQLVDMIVAQRNYQANAQTIKTMDQIMQTLVNMR